MKLCAYLFTNLKALLWKQNSPHRAILSCIPWDSQVIKNLGKREILVQEKVILKKSIFFSSHFSALLHYLIKAIWQAYESEGKQRHGLES